MERPKFPNETIRRLPLYLRCLNRLVVLGRDTLTSDELSDFLGIKSTQIRKDFSYFGDFGTRGVGYNLKDLIKEIRKILNLDEEWEIAVAGIGNIGCTILDHIEFNQPGFQIVFAFDQEPKLVGQTVRGVEVRHIDEIESALEVRSVQLGIVAVPAIDARDVANSLVRGGVQGIINLAPIFLNLPEDIQVVQMDLSSELGRLVYLLSNN